MCRTAEERRAGELDAGAERTGGRRRFVIFRPGALGDTLAAAPVVWALRRRSPEAAIEWLAELTPRGVLSARDVAHLLPEVSRVWLYDTESSSHDRLRFLRKEVRPARGDRLLYLCYSRESSRELLRDRLFFRLAGFRRQHGFRGQRGDLRRGGPPEARERETARLFRHLEADGLELDRGARGALGRDEAWAERFWRAEGLEGRRVVALCPGSKMQSKRWPAERFAAVADRLAAARPLLAFVAVGTEADRPAVEAVARGAGTAIRLALGASLLQTSALLARAALYLGNDTGPMHLAALHGTPCVSIFSALDREGLWEPWGEGHASLRGTVPCEGCFLEECFGDPPPCLAAIGVEEVFAAALETLRPRAARLRTEVKSGGA